MASKPVGLTDAKIRGLKAPPEGQIEIKDAIVPGLRLRVGASGARTFLLRKRVAGVVRNITIGRYSDRFGLMDARKKARIVLSDIEAGGDPYQHVPKPTRGAAAGTLRGMWPDYRAAKADRRSIAEIERVFNRHILPKFGDRMPETITRAEITRFIDSIALETPVMARGVLGQFSSFYGWALPRLERLQFNPCRDAGRPPPPKARDRVLDVREVGLLWNILGEEARAARTMTLSIPCSVAKRVARSIASDILFPLDREGMLADYKRTWPMISRRSLPPNSKI